MASIADQHEFESWLLSLQAGSLTEMQLATLQRVVDDGKAKNLEEAARLLDWQESVIDPTEHMYGH